MSEFNRHHLVYERWMYQTPTERRYRNLSQLVVPRMVVVVHDELHARVPTPPKPPLVLLIHALEHIETEDYDNHGTPDNVERLAKWYDWMAYHPDFYHLENLSAKIAKNLKEQLPYIREGAA